MPPGGARSGRPGVAYSNRRDMNANPRSPSTEVHGDVAKRERVKAATPGDPRPRATPRLTPLTAPSARPDEPVTAGVPIGPGPGPEVLGRGMGAAPADEALWAMRALADLFEDPPRDLKRIIALAEEEL